MFNKVNEFDFYDAMKKKNYDYMSDIYNEIKNNDCIDNANKYFFTELLDGNIIKLPNVFYSIIKSFGKNFYCLLKHDNTIEYYLSEFCSDEDYSYDYLKSTCVEIKKVKIYNNYINFMDQDVKQLNLYVGDIVQILLFDDCSFIVSKFKRTY